MVGSYVVVGNMCSVLGITNLLIKLILVPTANVSRRRAHSSDIREGSQAIVPCGMEKGIASTVAKGNFTNISLASPGLSISTVASRRKGCRVNLPSLGISLTIATPNCRHLFISIQKHRIIGVAVGRTVKRDCCSSIAIDTKRAMIRNFSRNSSSVPRSLSTLLGKRIHTISTSNRPKDDSSFFVHKLGSVRLSSRPLFIISKIV